MSHSYPEMRERIDDTTAVSTEGEIVLVADTADPTTHAMPNWARISHMPSSSDQYDAEIEEYYREQDAAAARQLQVEIIRHDSDFSKRNELLLKTVGQVSRQRRALAAATAIDNGVEMSAYGGSSMGAERAASYRHAQAVDLGAQACRVCPLAELCPLKPEELVSALEETNARRRFRGRVEKPENDHFCETNTTPGRLSKNVS